MTPTRRRPRQWIVPAIAAATLVVVPILVFGLAGEGDRWEAARLMESYLDGNRQAAIDGLATIVKRQPDHNGMKIRLARWLLDNSREQEALKLLDTIPLNARTAQVYRMICDGLTATGRVHEALELWRKFNPASVERGPAELLSHLNELAYRMALARSDLPLALGHIERVIADISSEWHAHVKDDLDPYGQVIIASTLLLRGDGSWRESGSRWRTAAHREMLERMLNPPIEELESMLADPMVMATDPADITSGGGDKGEQTGEPESTPDLKTRMKSRLSSLLTARALVYQDLGETARSQADRLAVQKLGNDPQSIADAWPTITECARYLSSLAAILDTRAVARYFSGRTDRTLLGPALNDLNLAIVAGESLLHSHLSLARASGFDSVDPREFQVEMVDSLKRSLAAACLHRLWIWNTLKNAEGVAADGNRIRELGFRPGPGLF